MPSTREIRRRIRSVKNTSQITHAMEMVAATKMRKAQSQALSSRPYSTILQHELSILIKKLGNKISHPLIKKNEENLSENIGIILLSTDKSLCGALNTNLFRKLITSDLKLSNVTFYTLGKNGRNFIIRSGNKLEADFENPETIHFKNATQLRKLVVEDFLSGKVSKVLILYPNFISTLRQEPTLINLLPITPNVIARNDNDEAISRKSKTEDLKLVQTNGSEDGGDNLLFDVSPTSLLDYLLTHHLDTQIFQAMLETKASEHSARMIAMKNATDNAKDLVSDLTLTYNGLRQDAITKELAEITTAGMALE